MEFWTIEVADGAWAPARRWRAAHGERLVEAALTNRAHEWSWVVRGWGVLLELGFVDESDWLRFRDSAAVRGALDAVPDPINGLFVYSGRGGSSAAGVPRRPRPNLGSGTASLPETEPEPLRPPPGLQLATFAVDSASGT
ncbi:MAG: hypothetical protein ABI345_01650 [Jatrophihabitans sp.]